MSNIPMMNRRAFLAGASCFGAAAALARALPLPALAEPILQDPRVAEAPLVDKGFAAVRKIGEGVYATIADFSKGPEALCNGGFIVGTDAALIVEGHHLPAGAAFELEALRLVSKVPVRAAVDSHYHFDHSLGNVFYGAQGIPVWAHAKTAPLMIERYARVQPQDKNVLLEPLNKAVQDAASPEQRQRAEGDLNAMKFILSSVEAAVIALPNRALDPAKLPMTVDLGGIQAVIEAYPGHTPSDLMVRVPALNITYTGDLLFNAWYPVTFDAEMSAWRATLGKFAAFGKDALFVPGHGQVCGQEGIATLRAVMDDLADQAEKMFQAGVPLREAQNRYVVPERFKAFVIFSWSFCVGSTIAKFYAEWEGQRAPAQPRGPAKRRGD